MTITAAGAQQHSAGRVPMPGRRPHLGGVDELVVDDVVGGVAEAVQGGGGVQEAGDAGAAVHVLPNTLQLGGVVEVGGADGLAHDVPVGARGADGYLLLLHDVRQLLPHLLRLAQHCSPAASRLGARGIPCSLSIQSECPGAR